MCTSSTTASTWPGHGPGRRPGRQALDALDGGPRPASGPSACSASVHDEAELERAVAAGADYVLASPVHPVRKAGRPSGAPLGLLGLEALVRAAPIPVLALGGVTPARLPEILATGVHGVAAMSGIGDAADPGAAVAAYLEALT
ncbi:MAG: thiamine phosphate synthase [Planctomycetota bacterium]